ncbi:Asp-tRNA(Asn)/Glu-tRNA(Gln) amidotransferase subunit GatA [Candidatus Gottesmanbacteria bacterium]|nr:Asp-tRNA(Asn)/Glu-tRNA(Gln) amidotransferase subunit GatA [Candidatus Gottesmanbacteria bacterium]
MELNTLTLTQAIEGLKTRTFSHAELIAACTDRIKSVEPNIKAFITVNQKVTNGIPIAVKDNFNTNDIETTAASDILRGYVPPYDATVVRKLKEHGMMILGKTNMDAFAHGSSTEASDFGATSNPWDLERLPGGSSGGSAAAVIADECIAAIGSETAGSIRQPASWCGVVGLKPTYGRVSRYGLIAMASSTDSPGPITKTVADARILYEMLAGFDPYDATTGHQPVTSEIINIKHLTIGVPKQYFRSEAQNGVNQRVLDAAKVLEKLGARLVDLSLLDPEYAVSVYTILQRAEVSSNLARFDGIRFGHRRDQFNEENKRRIMLGNYTLSAGYYDAYYAKAQKVRTLFINDFHKAFDAVDLIIGPTSPSTALKKGASKDHVMFGELQDILVEPSTIAGLPGINLPCGFIERLPVGMQLIGPQWSEDKILSVAQMYEEQTLWHTQRPKL